MFKCLRWYQTKNANVFPSIRFKAFNNRFSRHHSSKLFTQNAQNKTRVSTTQRSIYAVGVATQQTAVAQERSKYESNALPQNARVVICGGGVMGGK